MTTDEVVAAIAEMPRDEVPAVLAACAARLAAVSRVTAAVPVPRAPDVWIDAGAAAEIAGVSKKVVYDWARGQAWASRPSRRCLRINERAFGRWLASRS